MTARADPRVYVAHIVERLARIEQFAERGREAFSADVMFQDAVIRNLEVIGEAAKRIPEDYCSAHPRVPWGRLARFRDLLIHQYHRVNLDKVWSVIERDLPDLMTALTELLGSLEDLEQELNDDRPAGQEASP
ncbi:MAG: DUF86 domain-containing protein [Planctomycetes bacterium]|nr:DUF86 domain-containing protein [Planctomycetota bacterium]